MKLFLMTLQSLLSFQINPLNVHGLRKLDHCPPHFFAVDFDLTGPASQIVNWIFENLEGRFYFGDVVSIAEGSSGFSMRKRAGFEIHSEASYFALALSDINSFKL